MKYAHSGDEGFGQVICRAGFIPARRESKFALAVDPGQSIDPTAIAIVERVREPLDEIGADLIQRLGPPVYNVRWLERLPLQTSYIAVASHVSVLLRCPPLAPDRCSVILDRTGVGRGVADLFVHAGLNPIAVTITGGDRERQEADGSGWRVSKLELISKLQAALHSGEIKIARSLSEAAILASELADFRVNISDGGYASFGARVRKHDDLVLALALAIWHLRGPRIGGSWRVEPLRL